MMARITPLTLPKKLRPVTCLILERIASARNSVLDRIEDGHTKPLNGEQHDLRDALTTLDTLRRITERQNGYQSKAS